MNHQVHRLQGVECGACKIGAKLLFVEVLFAYEKEAVLAVRHCHVSEPSRKASNGDVF